ncbi:MAG: aminotransferase [Candidatus Marinimicrobia bacterium]|nr:aminotransferase [Candidatus Neomarinimicrobiota bacterium]|tara:strand:- start:100629 stop:102140 length:1512 start_codon:yes stop_codon:yes gene_type:complete
MKPTLLTPETMSVKGLDLLKKIQDDFIGLDTKYKLADGTISPRIYLDSTASTLMMGAAFRASKKFLNHYSNTHSLLHFSARISTKTYEWIHNKILDFVEADKNEYTSFFMGSGVTAGMNRVAKTLKRLRPERDIVLVSMMEHHSNDLPHRKHGGKVIHVPLEKNHQMAGKINTQILEKYLEKFSDRINYVSITGLSNVTGIINSINKIAKIVHKYNVYLIVDAAQMAAHVPIKMSGFNDKSKEIDVLLFSGHKTYAPGSPGVIIARKSFLSAIEPEDVGGGMVDKVYPDNYFVTKKFPDREEAGTPNILGAITLGASVHILDTIGMENILEEDKNLIQYTMNELNKYKEIHIYGDTDIKNCPRAGTISFNINGMDHGLVAAILNDYFNIAVRNECFCAHPYVQEMLSATHKKELDDCEFKDNNLSWKMEPWMGMVRISFGIYNNKRDVDILISSIDQIIKNKKKYQEQYCIDNNGDYKHINFKFSSDDFFSLTETIDNEIKIL